MQAQKIIGIGADKDLISVIAMALLGCVADCQLTLHLSTTCQCAICDDDDQCGYGMCDDQLSRLPMMIISDFLCETHAIRRHFDFNWWPYKCD